MSEESDQVTVTVRNTGDRIRFRVMPWIWPNATIYEGTIIEICDPEGDTYYVVDAMIGKEHLEEAIVFEREVVQEGNEEEV